jgi:hypothetical protein
MSLTGGRSEQTITLVKLGRPLNQGLLLSSPPSTDVSMEPSIARIVGCHIIDIVSHVSGITLTFSFESSFLTTNLDQHIRKYQ